MGPRYAFNNTLILLPHRAGSGLGVAVNQLREWRMNPILVLHPESAEEVLRNNPEAGELQMVMSERADTFLGALKAGLFLVKRPCFYLCYELDNAPLSHAEPFAHHWSGRLHPNSEQFEEFHIAGTREFGWVTSEGLRFLKSLSPQDDLWQQSELRIWTERAGTYAEKTS